MKNIGICWLGEEIVLEDAIKILCQASGQRLKHFYKSSQLRKKISSHEVINIDINLVNYLKINPKFEGHAPLLIKETEEYVAFHKPPGMHCHPHNYTDENTLLNYLQSQNFFSLLLINPQHYERSLLYRIDFETSGLVVLAKRQEAYQSIRSDFSKKMKKKMYLAIVDGDFNQEGTWEHYFLSSGVKGHIQKVFDHPKENAIKGSLKVRKLSYKSGKSLLLISLESGLRHQIRAQLASLGFPLLGDELYNGTKGSRLFLHCWRYEWENEIFQDDQADLFECFFDLNRALQMSLDMLRVF